MATEQTEWGVQAVEGEDTYEYAETGDYEHSADTPYYEPAQLYGESEEATGGWESPDPTHGYVYDPATGEYVFIGGSDGGVEGLFFALDETSSSPFGEAAYWQQYGEDEAPPTEEVASVVEQAGGATRNGQSSDAEEYALTPETPGADIPDYVETNVPTSPSSSRRRKQKGRSKEERKQMRQALLEKAEEEKAAQQLPESDATETAGPQSREGAIKQLPRRVETQPITFLERERAKFRLRMRKARAISRKRIPVQTRVLTETRRHLSPMETYFGGSLEPALSDIFWASIKGDMRRVRFLVEVEAVSAGDATFDPWLMEQTPLHWAAKGGNAEVVEYLIHAGANPRSLDETGSMPIHLACWAGHVDATLALLRATDTRDLYVQDYDAAFSPLDWASIRGHAQLIKAIEGFEDSKWLPKFVDDLIRGIIRYKIKLYKDSPQSKSPKRGINFRRQGELGIPTAAEKESPIASDGAVSAPSLGISAAGKA